MTNPDNTFTISLLSLFKELVQRANSVFPDFFFFSNFTLKEAKTFIKVFLSFKRKGKVEIKDHIQSYKYI